MSEEAEKYRVSYIATAPEELKVGDRVVIIDENDNMFEQSAVVVNLDRFYATIKFADGTEYQYNPVALRKLLNTISFEEESNPLNRQVGGSHYKDMVIQPIEFSMKNGLNACQHSIIKYVCRYKHKNGKEDLLKARHFIDLLIQIEYPDVDSEL